MLNIILSGCLFFIVFIGIVVAVSKGKTKVKLILIFSVFCLISVVFIVNAQEKNTYTIDPFADLSIKLRMKLQDTDQNLLNIRVSYDKDGEVIADDINVAIDDKNASKIIITPSSKGWMPESKYYVVIDKDILTANTKKLGNNKVIEIVTKPYKLKSISGIVQLEPGEKALTDINLLIYATAYDDFTIQYDTKVNIPEGESRVNYSIQVPVNKIGYSLGYEIFRADSSNEFNEEIYINPGYIGNDSNTGDFEVRKQFYVTNNVKQDIVIPWNRQIRNKVAEILEKTIQLDMSDYEKEVAIFKYVIENIEYDEAYISDTYTDKLWSSSVYLALLENKAVCFGYANVMKLLLNSAGIQCDFVTGKIPNGEGHVWNIVKLDNNYYYVDATRRNISALNFTDEQLNYMYGQASQYMSREKKCNSYDYNYRFRNYWIYNNIKIGTVVKVQGIIALPEGQIAPAGGETIKVVAGIEDNLMNAVYFDIPEGETSTRYSITVIPTEQPYKLRFFLMSNTKVQSSYDDVKIKNNIEVNTVLEQKE